MSTSTLMSGATAASFFDASEDCVKIVDTDGKLVAMNANGICLMEIDAFEDLGGQPWSTLWPDTERAQIEGSVARALEGKGSKFLADCPTAKGRLKSWDVTVWPVLDDAGHVTQIISMSRDVTDRRRVESENALLAGELAHRIKNMYAVMDGVIAMSARSWGEAKPLGDSLRTRVGALGKAMAYVAPSGAPSAPDRQHTLQGLLHALLEPYGLGDGGDQRIFVSGDDIALGHHAITPLALIMNELATNALKYGALGVTEGRVDVTIRATGDTVNLLWREQLGQALPRGSSADPMAKSGFGSILLENSVAQRMGGKLTRDWTPSGLSVTLEFPLDRVSQAT